MYLFDDAADDDNDADKKHDRLVKKEMIAGRDITLLSPSETYRNRVDMDYVYLQFDKPIHNWKDGEDIVKQVNINLTYLF